MPLGNLSRLRLSTCRPELVTFVEALADGIDAGECPGVEDITVLCGHRGEEAQNKAFADGASKKRWPDSEHNTMPSNAVDVAPYPVKWKDLTSFEALRTYGLKVAQRLGIRLRIISWDWPHWELAKHRRHR